MPPDWANFICSLTYSSRSTVNHLFEQRVSAGSLLIVALKMSIIRERTHIPELAPDENRKGFVIFHTRVRTENPSPYTYVLEK